jgi:uncharacterized protein
VHQDGLVHISQMADRFVKNPADVVKVQQKVSVTVLEVDMTRNRISLSMKSRTDLPRTDVKPAAEKTPQPRFTEAKKKQGNNRKPAFSSPLADALIKSGLK